MRLTRTLVATAMLGGLTVTGAAAQSALQLHLLSNPRPEMVSGGDALVAIDPGAGAPASGITLAVSGVAPAGAFRKTPARSRQAAAGWRQHPGGGGDRR